MLGGFCTINRLDGTLGKEYTKKRNNTFVNGGLKMGNEEKKVVKVKTVKVKPKEAPAPEPVKVEVPEEPVKQEPVAEKAAAPFYK